MAEDVDQRQDAYLVCTWLRMQIRKKILPGVHKTEDIDPREDAYPVCTKP